MLKFIVYFIVLYARSDFLIIAIDQSITCENTKPFEVYVAYQKHLQRATINGCLVNQEFTAVVLESKLDSIETGTFINLTNLETITLQRRDISKLKPRFIVNAPNLKKIFASNNLIRAIVKDVFNELNLTHLVLHSNRIHSMDDGAFANTSISRLDLSNNHLTEIKPGWFEDTSIESLDLGYNRLTSLKENTFRGITNLRVINLNYNRISVIKVGTFSEQPDLQELHLAGNDLTYVHFVKDMTLNVLDVGFNEISNVIIDNSSRVKMVLIYPNPWNCRCLQTFWRDAWENDVEYGESKTSKTPIEIGRKPICLVSTYQDSCNKTSDIWLSKRYFNFVNYKEFGRYIYENY